MSTTDPVAAAIAQARQSADAMVPAVASIATSPAPMGVGRVRTLADAVETFVERPDLFIKVDYYGIHIEDDGIIKELFGTIDLNTVKFPDVCRYTRAGTHDYLRTYDGIREVKSGKGWAQALEDAKRVDDKADVYQAVEFMIELLKKPTKAGGDKPVPEIGQRVGHATSRTGYDPVMKFLKETAPIVGPTATVNVRVFHTAKTRGQNKWGVLGVELMPNS